MNVREDPAEIKEQRPVAIWVAILALSVMGGAGWFVNQYGNLRPAKLSRALISVEEAAPSDKGKAVIQAGLEWADHDPEQGAKWAAGLPASLRKHALISLADGLSHQDVENACDWLVRERSQFEDAKSFRRGIRTLMDTWAEEDPDDALHWVKDHPDTDVVAEGLAALVVFRSDEVFNYLESQPTGVRAKVGPQVMNALAKGDSKLAFEFHGKLPKDLSPASSLNLIMDQMCKDDFSEAVASMSKIPAGIPRDRASFVVMKTFAEKSDLNSAVNWVQEIDNPTIRKTALLEMAQILGEQSLRYLRRARSSKGFSPEEHELLGAEIERLSAAGFD